MISFNGRADENQRYDVCFQVKYYVVQSVIVQIFNSSPTKTKQAKFYSQQQNKKKKKHSAKIKNTDKLQTKGSTAARIKAERASFCTFAFLQVGLAHSLEQTQRGRTGLCIVALITESTLAAEQQQQKRNERRKKERKKTS